jgi:K+-transporting ATPase A subunit
MKSNMGTTDKLIRLLIAAVILILYFTNVITGTLSLILFIIAAIFILTSIIGICPAYLPFRFSTRKKEEQK